MIKSKKKYICPTCKKCQPTPKGIEQCREWEDVKIWRVKNGKG